jgi:hypothetical protein
MLPPDGVMNSKKKIKSRQPTRSQTKKRSAGARRKKLSRIPLSLHRAVEMRFMDEHPEAFDPFIGEWVVLEGNSILSHGPDPVTVVNEARDAGISVPLIFYVEPKLGPNQGRLGL